MNSLRPISNCTSQPTIYKTMKPTFNAGTNIAMKVPTQEYEQTVTFYRDVLGLPMVTGEVASSTESIRFHFGDKVLWIDKVASLSQAEIWLEIVSDDIAAASAYLEAQGCDRRDEIEPLPTGFWISNPGNIIHLVTAPTDG